MSRLMRDERLRIFVHVPAERKLTHIVHNTRPFLRVLRGYPQVSQPMLDELERRSPNERVEVEKTQAMLRAAVVLTGDEDLGLRAARATEVGDYEVLEYVCASAPTWRAAIEAAVRYRNIVDEAADLRLEVHGGTAHLVLGSTFPLERAGIDFQVAAFFMAVSRWLRSVPEGEVSFRHPEPADLAQYRETFGVQAIIRFGAEFDGLIFDAQLLDTPMRTAEATVHGVLRARADRLLAEVAATGDSWLGRARADILAMLPSGRLNAADTARRLGISRRTLARRLEQADTSFSAQVQDLRKHTAEHYLRETDHNVEEIAFLLGFSESPPFVRAFKRWKGVSPLEFRRAQRGH